MKTANILLTKFFLLLLPLIPSGVILTLLLLFPIEGVMANNNLLDGCTGATASSVYYLIYPPLVPDFGCDQLLIHNTNNDYVNTDNDANVFWCSYLATPKIVSTVEVIARQIIWAIPYD